MTGRGSCPDLDTDSTYNSSDELEFLYPRTNKNIPEVNVKAELQKENLKYVKHNGDTQDKINKKAAEHKFNPDEDEIFKYYKYTYEMEELSSPSSSLSGWSDTESTKEYRQLRRQGLPVDTPIESKRDNQDVKQNGNHIKESSYNTKSDIVKGRGDSINTQSDNSNKPSTAVPQNGAVNSNNNTADNNSQNAEDASQNSKKKKKKKKQRQKDSESDRSVNPVTVPVNVLAPKSTLVLKENVKTETAITDSPKTKKISENSSAQQQRSSHKSNINSGDYIDFDVVELEQAIGKSVVEEDWQKISKKQGATVLSPLNIKDKNFPSSSTRKVCLACSGCSREVDSNQPYDFYIEFNNQKHNCLRNILFVQNKSESVWKKIRERNDVVVFPGSYALCNKIPNKQCPQKETCSFAHSDIERELWNLDKINQFSIKIFISKHSPAALNNSSVIQNKPVVPSVITKPTLPTFPLKHESPTKLSQASVIKTPALSPPKSTTFSSPVEQITNDRTNFMHFLLGSQPPRHALEPINLFDYYNLELVCSECKNNYSDFEFEKHNISCYNCRLDVLVAKPKDSMFDVWMIIRPPKICDLGYDPIYELCKNIQTYGTCIYGESCDNPHNDGEKRIWNWEAKKLVDIKSVVSTLYERKKQQSALRNNNSVFSQNGAFAAFSSGAPLSYESSISANVQHASGLPNKTSQYHLSSSSSLCSFPLEDTHIHRIGCFSCLLPMPTSNGYTFYLSDSRDSHYCALDRLFICLKDNRPDGWKLIRPKPDSFITNSLCHNFSRKQECSNKEKCEAPHSFEEKKLWNFELEGQFSIIDFINQCRKEMRPRSNLLESKPVLPFPGLRANVPNVSGMQNSLFEFQGWETQTQQQTTNTWPSFSQVTSQSTGLSQDSDVELTSSSNSASASASASVSSIQPDFMIRKPASYLNALDDFDEPSDVRRTPVMAPIAPPSKNLTLSPRANTLSQKMSSFPVESSKPISFNQSPPQEDDFILSNTHEHRLVCEDCIACVDRLGFKFNIQSRTHNCKYDVFIVRVFGDPSWRLIRPMPHPSSEAKFKEYNICMRTDKEFCRSTCFFAHSEEEKFLWNAEKQGQWTPKHAAVKSDTTVLESTAPCIKAVCYRCKNVKHETLDKCTQGHIWVRPLIVFTTTNTIARAIPITPKLRIPKHYVMCDKAASGKTCTYGDKCIFPHSKDEEKLWNLMIKKDEFDLQKFYQKFCS